MVVIILPTFSYVNQATSSLYLRVIIKKFRPCLCSMGIESVLDENKDKTSDGVHDAMCTACEMAVVWMANQLRRNQTEEQILNYVNQVILTFLFTFLE